MVSSLSVWRHTCSRLMWVVERRKHVLICVAWKHVSRGRVTHPRFVWRSGDLQFPFTNYWLGVHSKKIQDGRRTGRRETQDQSEHWIWRPKSVHFIFIQQCSFWLTSNLRVDPLAVCTVKVKKTTLFRKIFDAAEVRQCHVFKLLFRTRVLIRAEL